MAIALDFHVDNRGFGPESVAGGGVGFSGLDNRRRDENSDVHGGVQRLHERGDLVDRDLVLLCSWVCEDRVGG